MTNFYAPRNFWIHETYALGPVNVVSLAVGETDDGYYVFKHITKGTYTEFLNGKVDARVVGRGKSADMVFFDSVGAPITTI